MVSYVAQNQGDNCLLLLCVLCNMVRNPLEKIEISTVVEHIPSTVVEVLFSWSWA